MPIKLTMAFFAEQEQKVQSYYGNTHTHTQTQTAKATLSGRKEEMEESVSLTSAYTTKLQSSKQYGTDRKTGI